jgi:hypothetical protein
MMQPCISVVMIDTKPDGFVLWKVSIIPNTSSPAEMLIFSLLGYGEAASP